MRAMMRSGVAHGTGAEVPDLLDSTLATHNHNGASSMIHVVAVITAKPGQRAKLLEAFAANRAAVLAEEGCIEYGAAVDAQGVPTSKASFGPDTFVVIEKWETLAHLQAHAVAPHMKAHGEKTKELVESKLIHVLEPV